MALHTINGVQTQTQQIDTTGDTWLFEDGVTFTNSGILVGTTASDDRILFNGHINTAGTGIYEVPGAIGNNFVVGKDASISAVNSVFLSGEGTSFTNYGTMGTAAADGKGAYLITGVQTFRNFGTINVTGAGQSAGIFVAATEGLTIENHGMISCKITGINVTNGNADIVNAQGGTIAGDEFAVRLGSGNIIGLETSLTNAGHISSGKIAVEGSVNGDFVSNTGTIDGQVTLGDGSDHFSNAGTLNGDIFLGKGNDYFSNKGDWTTTGIFGGGSGNDTIDLRGGTASDGQGGTPQIWGDSGNDTYIVDKTTFDLRESFNGGVDTVKSTTSFALADNFENLTLLGSKNIDGNGNGSDNVITGNAGNNILNGMGGEDLIDGGAGIDTLVFDANGAKGVMANLLLGNARGADNHYSFISNIENVRGTQFADILLGDRKANVIEGGAGGDLLNGNGGKDTLSYEHSSDAVSVDLKANTRSGGDAEGDILAGFENLQGSAHDDTLGGDDGKNLLTGGRGNDILTGYGAADTFIFSGHFGKDEITDFSAGDRVDFSQGPMLFKDFDAMMAHVTVSGDDLVIHHGKDTLTLDHTDMSDLHASQFHF